MWAVRLCRGGEAVDEDEEEEEEEAEEEEDSDEVSSSHLKLLNIACELTVVCFAVQDLEIILDGDGSAPAPPYARLSSHPSTRVIVSVVLIKLPALQCPPTARACGRQACRSSYAHFRPPHLLASLPADDRLLTQPPPLLRPPRPSMLLSIGQE